ncbi:hypothetical protein [Streptomyces mayteni]
MLGISIVTIPLALLSFMIGFQVPSKFSDEVRTDQCRSQLGLDVAPPTTEPVELSSRFPPPIGVCTWPDGTTVEVRYQFVDDRTLRLLSIAAAAGLLSWLVPLAAQRASKPSARPPGRRPEGKPSP